MSSFIKKIQEIGIRKEILADNWYIASITSRIVWLTIVYKLKLMEKKTNALQWDSEELGNFFYQKYQEIVPFFGSEWWFE